MSKLKYEQLLEEEKIELQDLPQEIRMKINAIKPNVARFDKTGSDEIRKSIIKQDASVCQLIYDFLEESLPDEEAIKKREAEESAKKKEEEDAAAAASAEEAKIAEEAAKKKEEEDAATAEEEKRKKEESDINERAASMKNPFGTAAMEKQVLSILEEKSLITINQLQEIIGQKPSDPYQVVCTIRLHKPYLKSYYVKA
jgi:membrane protein involved in colicin uptake